MRSFRTAELAAYALVAFVLIDAAASASVPAADPSPVHERLAECNVVWTSPSKGPAGSMPLGNGDLAANVWVEPGSAVAKPGGDLVLLLAKSDAWSGNGRLLKLGRVRVTLAPAPAREGQPFRQSLVLEDGEIRVESGAGDGRITMRIWVDANRPVVHVEAEGARPMTMSARLELWRTRPEPLPAHERFSAYGIVGGGKPIVVEADTVLPARDDRLVWYHRNTKSCYPITMQVQGLGHLLDKYPDPLLGRTFGCCMRGEGLIAADDRTLKSARPARRQHLRIYALTARTKTAEEWTQRLARVVAKADTVNAEEARRAHRAWWRAFWQRSWIFASATPKAVSRALAGSAAAAWGKNTLPLRIAADTSKAAANRFVGRIARVRIYDRPLTAEQVARLAAQPPGAPVAPAEGLVAGWRFDKAAEGAFPNAAAGPKARRELAARIVGQVQIVAEDGVKAAAFDGKGYLHVGHDPTLVCLNGLTLEAWIAPGRGGKPTGGRIIDKTTVAKADGYLLDAWPRNSLRLITPTGSPIHRANFPPGRWVHVAATYDPRLDARQLYVHGKAVVAEGAAGGARPGLDVVTRGYALQRFVNACAGRGAYPIKFNGSLFTVSGGSGPKAYDADHRAWGGCYWFQNTRLPYWSMLAAGDFDLMAPLFRMYLRALPLSRERTRKYFGHGGAHFPETMYFWGTYNNDNYGWRRQGKTRGITDNTYIRYYWQGGIELSVMMADRYARTQDRDFAQQTLVPFAGEIVTFFDEHWKRDKGGKVRFSPAQSLETWHVAVNPLPEIAGLTCLLGRLLALPEDLTGPHRRKQWRRLLGELPPLPVGHAGDPKTAKARKYLKPADTYSRKANAENPELYAVWPYELFGVGKPDLDVGRLTFGRRLIKRTGGWFQDAIQAACLGLSAQAARDVLRNFSAKDPASRFPAFWQRNFDWVPDQDHGGVSMIALQRMLMQTDGRRIRLLPAWPREWDVDYKLHAPRNTTVRLIWRAGRLQKLVVQPPDRGKDVRLMPDPPGAPASRRSR